MTTRWSAASIARGRDTLDAARGDVEAVEGSVLAVVDVRGDVEEDARRWWPVAAMIVIDPAPQIDREDLARLVGAHDVPELYAEVRRHLDRVADTAGRQIAARWQYEGTESGWSHLAAEHGLDDDGGFQ